MTSYKQAIRQLSTNKADIEATLSNWERAPGFGSMIVPNIRAEHFLHSARMVALLKGLHSARTLSVSELEGTYLAECHRHSLQGGRVPSNSFPALVGRAVERKIFERYLRRQGYCTTKSEAKDFVKRRLAAQLQSTRESEHMMSPFGAWVTWSQALTKEPFDFVFYGDPKQLRAWQVRAALGLQHDGGELLLLVYKLPQETALCRPTIADAALSYYFQPSRHSNRGETRPWPNRRGMMAIPNYTPQPRPEGVHCPVRMENLEYLWQLT